MVVGSWFIMVQEAPVAKSRHPPAVWRRMSQADAGLNGIGDQVCRY